MKLSEILVEMPVNLNKNAPFVFSIDGSYISNNSLDRDFDFLGELNVDSMKFKFWLSKRMNRALVTTVSTEKTPDTVDSSDNLKNLIVCDAFFKEQNIINLNNAFQIDTVSTNTKFSGRNLAMILYIVLARYGYIIISDFEQYNGGVGLWKTLAKQSGNRKYVVRIWSIKNNDWLRNNNNDIIKYDLNNIPSDKVWNVMGERAETLLVLSSK